MPVRLPPLTSLKAFEAAARHLSVKKAALELNVTRPAISKQIALLERDLACQLLNDARYSVNEIGTLLGYGDAANFGRAFRRMTGISPGQYRRRISSFITNPPVARMTPRDARTNRLVLALAFHSAPAVHEV